MALLNAEKIFKDALKKSYAVGAFNFVNLETLKSIIETAQKLHSPVIIQSSMSAIKYAGIDNIKALVYAMAKNTDINICWNLDHAKSFEECKTAIDYGFTNVMIDASDKPFEENVSLTKKVVEYAHKKGVTVEAELGVLKGIEDDVNVSESQTYFTNPLKAKEFVERTGIDSLAISIGTSHGAYKFKGEAKLRFDILNEIEKLLPSFPLVLHGASSIPSDVVKQANKYGAKLEGVSGVTEELLKKACKTNICKINVDSDLRLCFIAGLRKSLVEEPENIDIRKPLTKAMLEINKTIEYKIVNVFNSYMKN